MLRTEKELALAIMRDRTERVRIEQAMHENEQRYQLLFAVTQRQAQELGLFDQLRQALASEPDLATFCHTVVQTVADTLGYTQIGLYLIEGNILMLQSHIGHERILPHIPLTQSVSGRVARSGQPILLQDTHSDPDFLAVRDDIVSEACVPLLDQGQVVGVLDVGMTGDRLLTEADLRILQALSEHVGIALSKARLQEETRRSLARLQALGQISRMARSLPELSQVLFTIARHAAQLGGADAAGLYEIDQIQRTLGMIASHSASATFIEAVNDVRLRVGQGVVGRAVATLRPVQINNAPTESACEFSASMSAAGYNSVLAVPMISQDKPVGSLVLWSRQSLPFGADVIELLMTLADQAVMAIENARLCHESKRRLEQASIVQAMALAGADGKPFDEIVAEVTKRLSRLWDSQHLGFLFPDETGALQVHTSYLGVTPEFKRNTRILPGTGIAGWVFQTGQPVIVPDVRYEPRYIKANPVTLSEMAAPLIARNRVIGVVNVESAHLDAFSTEDLGLLMALAGQLAIILDDTQAHRDLAEQVKLLQAAYDELAEAEQIKDQMVQNVSHELRTPMTFIKGYADLMLAETFGPLPVGLREFVEIISRKADNLTRLIERIVALKAMYAQTLQIESIHLDELVQYIAARWQSQAQQMGVDIDTDLPDDLPMIEGDRRQLSEALGNLLSNAIKFSRPGGYVRLAARHEAGLIHIEVADTGVGIPPGKLDKIFERFYQVDGTARRRFGGTGVGLAVVRRIIEAHDGRIWAESEGPGQGSKFHVVLPVACNGSSLVMSSSRPQLQVP